MLLYQNTAEKSIGICVFFRGFCGVEAALRRFVRRRDSTLFFWIPRCYTGTKIRGAKGDDRRMKPPRLLLCCAALACVLSVSCAAPQASESASPRDPAPQETASAEALAAQPTAAPVVFRNGASFSPDATELTVVPDADEYELLDRFPALTSVDLSGASCCPELLAWTEAHPDVAVRYTVPLGGVPIENDAVRAEIPTLTDPDLLQYLPALRALTVTEPIAPETAALLAARADLTLCYTVRAGDLTIPNDTVELDASGLSPAYADDLAAAIPALPKLRRIRLRGADGTSDWTLDQADALQRAREGVLVDYPVTAFGRTFSLADEVVSFNNLDLGRKTNELRALLPYLRNVGRLDMENCNIGNRTMANLREAFPNPKIVWRVHVGKYSCRTDAIMIKFSYDNNPYRLHNDDLTALQYCNEVQYLDLGHNRFSNTRFLYHMPEIRVLIVAAGYVTDISGVETCTKLEYCEFLSGGIRDVSPLAACTELKHLNIAYNKIDDITPLYGLKKLERLWMSRNPIPQEQIDTIRSLLPDCVIDTTTHNPTGGGWRYLADGTISERYALLRNQFFYGTGMTSYTEETRPALP